MQNFLFTFLTKTIHMNISFISKLRKSVAGFAILGLMATFFSFVSVAQAGFTDTEGHWAEDYISELVSQGVVSGKTSTTFDPEGTLLRAEMAKIAVLAFAGEDEVDEDYDAGFVDVDEDAWYAAYVNTAAKLDMVGGYTDSNGVSTGYFGPGDTVTRAAGVKILVAAAGLSTDETSNPFEDVASGSWYEEYVLAAYWNSVLDGTTDTTFSPADSMTRGAAAKVTVNAQNPETRSSDDSDDDDDDTTSDADLEVETVSLSGGTVPKSATAVEMLGLEFTAGGDDVELSSLVVQRNGVGATSDFSNLYFFHGSERIGSGRSISTDTNLATFSGLNLTVEQGETEMVWIKADFSSSATASNQNYLSIESADDVESDAADVDGDFPLAGPSFTVGGATAGTITIEKNSTVSNPTIGETDAEIADFKLTASNEDMELEQIALAFKGSISQDGATNFQLLQNGEVLATTDDVNNDDLFTFDLDTPFTIEKGDSRTFSVTAEVTSKADADDTVKVYLDENTDLVAIGQVYGYGAAVTSSSYDNSADDGTDANHSTVQGGKFTVAFNGPSLFEFAPNEKDVNMLDLTFTAGRDVEVRQLGFSIVATGSGLVDADDSTANFTDIKLINSDTGATLMGPAELSASGSDSDQTVTFTDSWYLDAGESINASVTMDIANESTLDDTPTTMTVTLDAISTSAGVKDTGTGEFLSDIVPSGAIAGYAHKAQASSLTLALASSPVSDTIVKGTSQANLVGFVMSAGDASEITISKFQPTVNFTTADPTGSGTWSVSGSTGSTTYAKEIVETLYLYDEDGNQIGDSEAVPNSGKPTFDSEDIIVPAGESITVYVKGDISTTSSAYFAGIDIEATSDITAEDEDSNSVTLSAADVNSATDGDAPSVYMTISTGGSIVVSSPTSQTNDKIVAANAEGVLVGKMKVKATDEDFKVTKLALFSTLSGSQDSFESLTIKYPTSLSAPTTLDGDSTVTFSGTAVTFNNLNFMVPAENDNVVFEIYADVNSHNDDSGAADTGDTLQVTLYPYASSFEAEGVGSGSTKDGDDSGVIASGGISTNSPYVFKSVPTVTVSDTTGSIVYGAQSEVFRFTVDADANGDIALLGLRLDVSSSGIATDSTGLGGLLTSGSRGDGTAGRWEMFEVVGGSTDYSTTVGSGEFVNASNYGGSSDVVYMEVFDNITNWYAGNGSFEQIGANDDRTYVITTTVLDDGTDNTNSISVRIGNDSSALFARTATFASGTPEAGDLKSAAFVWGDTPNNSSFATGAAYWHNGYKVTGLPSSYVSSS